MHITAAADRQHAVTVQRPGQVAAVALRAQVPLFTMSAAKADTGKSDTIISTVSKILSSRFFIFSPPRNLRPHLDLY